jgi:HSP20 family protein
MAARVGPLTRLRSEFDRLFDDFFQGWPTVVTAGDAGQGVQGVDVQERDDAVVVRADAPGFDPGDFDVEIRGDNLVLCACQSEESSEEEGFRWQKRELFRSVPLPAEIDADNIDAKYRNGILTIKLPKTEQAKGKKIEIKS